MVYTPQRVYTSDPGFDIGKTALDVEVVAVDATVIREANASSYYPRALPEVFGEPEPRAVLIDKPTAQSALGKSSSASSSSSQAKAQAHSYGQPAKTALYTPHLPKLTLLPATERRAQLKPPPFVKPESYTIGIGDVLLISSDNTAKTVSDLNILLAGDANRRGYVVQSNGAITAPEIGEIYIAGLTAEKASEALAEKLVEHGVDPAFSLEISEFNSQRVTIGGAVKSPGALPITLRPMTLWEAIDIAGGLSVDNRDELSVHLYRNDALYEIPGEALYEDNTYKKFYLKDRDAVFVDYTYNAKRATEFFTQQTALYGAKIAQARLRLAQENHLMVQQNHRDQKQERIRKQAIQNFETRRKVRADATEQVFLAGEVLRQGAVELPYERRASLAEVFYGSGGADPKFSDPSEIYVLRSWRENCDCDVTAYHFDMTNALNLPLLASFEMRPNDFVFVQSHSVTDWNRVISQIAPVTSILQVPGNVTTSFNR